MQMQPARSITLALLPPADATSVPSVVLPSSVQRWFPVSKDTLHEGLRGRGRATTETKEAKGNRRGGGCWRARAASSNSNSRRASCSNWFVGRSGAANKVAQIGKNETLMALIRRNASAASYSQRACRVQRREQLDHRGRRTSSSSPNAHARVAVSGLRGRKTICNPPNAVRANERASERAKGLEGLANKTD